MLYVMLFGWNWARAPLQRFVSENTGRQLVIAGDLSVRLGWPTPRVRAQVVSFANPAWATQPQMLVVDEIDFSINLFQLLRKKVEFPEVHLTRPVVYLELAADGRKTWLLDRQQSDERARIRLGRLTLDQGQIGYDDVKQKTSIRANLSTQKIQQDGIGHDGVIFNATGHLKGLALKAHGSSGSVLALEDESVPYPLKIDATIGRTNIQAEGSVTSLIKVTALDMQLALRGDSLARLYPLLGIALPQTNAYATAGHLVHRGPMWRYEKFTGHMGNSDIAGTLQLDPGNARPFLHGELVSQVFDLDDLGPLIGDQKQPLVSAVPDPHLLPVLPFKTERWNSVDADVKLRAKVLLRAKALPLENLVAHLKMENSRLTLDPLDFGFAGGHLKAAIVLDGQQDPIQAQVRIGARKILLAKLFPTVNLTKTSIGQINGDFDLKGKGNSVGRMFATADGRVSLVVENGEISKLLMEQIGLHLVEILQLKILGDKTIKLRCGVADFGVKSGIMEVNALVLDTEVSTIVGRGHIDLGQEKLDLRLMPKTRNTSPVALRSPIYIRGTFSDPEVSLDKGRVAARGIGAVALALINPLLALLPLVETGPGLESECGRLIQEAQSPK